MTEKNLFTLKEIKKRFRYNKIQSDNDVFFKLKNKSVRKIKEILQWANNKGFRTSVDLLDAGISLARTKADKTFEEVIELIHKDVFFVVILRKNTNLFLIVSDEAIDGDYLEIGIRNIDVDNKEYFIFIYLEPKHLDYLLETYDLVRRGE